MKRSMKRACITACVLVVAGLLTAFGGLVLLVFDFTKMSNSNLTTATYPIEDVFSRIEINTETCDVRFAFSEDESYRVVCRENEKMPHTVTVKNDTLYIQGTDERKWYDYIQLFSFEDTEIIVYCPKNVQTLKSLGITTSTGDVEILDGFGIATADIVTGTGDISIGENQFTALLLKTSTGDIALRNVSVGGYTSGVTTNCPLEITTDTGDVSMYDCHGDIITVETDTGDVNLKNLTANGLSVTCNTGAISLTEADAISNVILETDTGDVSLTSCNAFTISALTDTGDVELEACFPTNLSVTTDTGDVALSYCDGKYITVKTQTGDVEGVLLSGKIFDCKSNTGDVRVPKNGSDGTCTVTSDTGDIEITVQPKERNL